MQGRDSSPRARTKDVKRIFCAYHPDEFLTNFCLDLPDAPLPLLYHYHRSDKPLLLNLQDAFQEAREHCSDLIVQLEEFDRRNGELSSYMNGLAEYVRKQLSECKQSAFALLEQSFEDYEETLLQQIRAKYREQGVFSRQECQEVHGFIASQIDRLYEQISHLKGDQCLAALIRFHQEDQLQEDIDAIADFLTRHRQAGGLSISFDSHQAKQLIAAICNKSVVLDFVSEGSESFDKTGTKSPNRSRLQHLNSSKGSGFGSKVFPRRRNPAGSS